MFANRGLLDPCIFSLTTAAADKSNQTPKNTTHWPNSTTGHSIVNMNTLLDPLQLSNIVFRNYCTRYTCRIYISQIYLKCRFIHIVYTIEYLNAIAYCLIAKSTFKQHAIGLFWCSCATWNCEVVTFEVFLSFIGLFCKH